MSVLLDLEATWNVLRSRRIVRVESVRGIVATIDTAGLGRGHAPREAVVRAHAKAFHGPVGRGRGTCLERSFGLARLLRRHGHDAHLVIGVRDGTLEDGHAWVELDGAPLGEPEGKIEQFREFLRAPSTPSRESES